MINNGALDKGNIQRIIFFLSHQKYMIWHSLDLPHRGDSNENP